MTAELAIGMVGAVLVLAAVLSVAVAAQAQVAVEAAAAAGARAAARGDAPERVVSVAAARGGPGSAVHVAGGGTGGVGGLGGSAVEVRVERRVRLVLPGVPHRTVHGRATAQVEAPSTAPSALGATAPGVGVDGGGP